MKMECVYCGSILKTELTLKHHQKTAKYCLIKQNKNFEEHKCFFCKANFILKSSLYKHLKICKENIPLIQLQQLVEKSYELYFNKKNIQDKLRDNVKDNVSIFFNEPIKAKRILDESQKIIPEYLLSFDEGFHKECIKHCFDDGWV